MGAMDACSGGRSGSSLMRAALLLGVALMACGMAMHEQARAQSTTQCTNALSGLLPCLGYLQEGNTTAPGADCCSPLSTFVTAQPDCLCQLVPIAKGAGQNVNATRALEVVSACKITLPANVTSCLSGVSGSPSSSPSPSGEPTPAGSAGPPPQSGNDGNGVGTSLCNPLSIILATLLEVFLLALYLI